MMGAERKCTVIGHLGHIYETDRGVFDSVEEIYEIKVHIYCESPLLTEYPICVVLGNSMALLIVVQPWCVVIRSQYIYTQFVIA